MEGEPCRLCGGDGRIGNALAGGGSSATCPSCRGTGRRAEASYGFHDVTKTKPSHHRPAAPVSTGPKVPTTPEGEQLAREVKAQRGPRRGREDAAHRGDCEPREHARTLHQDLHQEGAQAGQRPGSPAGAGPRVARAQAPRVSRGGSRWAFASHHPRHRRLAGDLEEAALLVLGELTRRSVSGARSGEGRPPRRAAGRRRISPRDQPFRSAYMRRVVAVHAPRPARRSSIGVGSRVLPRRARRTRPSGGSDARAPDLLRVPGGPDDVDGRDVRLRLAHGASGREGGTASIIGAAPRFHAPRWWP